MALVNYSDSEDSDTETPITAPKPTVTPAKAAAPFQKTEARKIKVDLPSLKPEAANGDGAEQPPAKRARTAGAFGDFNSLLPAPRRAAAQTGLKKGVSLKTSSEAAFSRVAPPVEQVQADEGGYDEFGNRAKEAPASQAVGGEKADKETEVKIVGKATKFRPLSVANNKKKKVVKKAAPVVAETVEEQKVDTQAVPQETRAPVPKPKKSLFSVQQEEVEVPADAETDGNEAFTTQQEPAHTYAQSTQQVQPTTDPLPAPSSLESLATDLNLTPAQRRHLFGRQGKDINPANIAHFNMDNEYAANEQIRQSGETIEHRAVKSIAPGKHSLQQLVNNARSNQNSIEDKWAEGRRARGEGGSKYGW